jgi:adenylosuccinate synthase
MTRARVIIGSGFGDEGEGLATDFYAAPYGRDALVVRFNGGAQAGHTVVTADGRRHVFSHVGAGTLTGATTFLSRFFVCHPMLLREELEALRALGSRARILTDRDCMVTTPFDVMINQAVEAARGRRIHGTCGLGFGETIEREEKGRIALRAGDLGCPDRVAGTLRQIRDAYMPRRLAALGVGETPDVARDEAVIDRFIEDARLFSRLVRVTDSRVLGSGPELVFEGAQGLLLDMDRGHFPHVTRSNTGLRNVFAIAHEAGLEALDVSYATRVYATRHGAGPMRHELAHPPFPALEDRTNTANRWQGRLRYGLLDVEQLSRAVLADLADAGNMQVNHEWFLTWMDRVEGLLPYVVDGRTVEGTGESLASALSRRTATRRLRFSFGETRATVVDGTAAPLAKLACRRGWQKAATAPRASAGSGRPCVLPNAFDGPRASDQ